jgi:hypothetical protein
MPLVDIASFKVLDGSICQGQEQDMARGNEVNLSAYACACCGWI